MTGGLPRDRSTPERDPRSRPGNDDGALAGRVARGSLTLLLRQGVAFTALFVASVAQARILVPSEVGTVAVCLLVFAVGRILVDGGLSSSVIHQDEPPTRHDVRSVLRTQTVAAVALAAAVAVASSTLNGSMPSWFSTSAVSLAAITLLTVPLTTVSTALLERTLSFKRLGAVSLIQPCLLAVGSGVALPAFPTTTGALAVFAISHLVAVPAYLAASGIGVRGGGTRGVRSRWHFGLPIAGGQLVSQVKDGINPLVLSWVLGITAVGYISWAQQLAVVATYAVAALSSIYFPLLARLRNQPERFARAVSAAAFWANATVAPVSVVIAVNTYGLVHLVYGDIWDPAVPTLRLLMVANLVAPVSAVLLSAFNALGRPRVGLAYTVAWAVATWALVPSLSAAIGVEGYGVANILVSAISLGLLWQARGFVDATSMTRAWLPWVVASASVALPWWAVSTLGDGGSATGTLVHLAMSAGVYCASLVLVCRTEVRALRKALFDR
ncbi:MAG: hypothetical protein JWN84_4639 [Nocardioides sp.]|nr:hypothetical protein [Nocardioides sp.]